MAEKQDVALRVMRIYTLLINGHSGTEIAHNAALQSEFAVQERQMWVYINRARGLLQEEAGRVREREVGKAILRYEKMYRKMEAVADYRGCLAAQARIDDLLGLQAARKMDVTTNGKSIEGAKTDVEVNICGISSSELTALIKAGRE